MTVTVRDLRESKNISQDKAADAAGLSYSKYVRIEEGSGRTTQEEIDHVLKVLEGMEPGTRKLAGRPFKDPAKQQAVKEAREKGTSVAAALGYGTKSEPSGDKKETSDEQALAKKAPNRSKSKAKAKPAEEHTDQAEVDDVAAQEQSVDAELNA